MLDSGVSSHSISSKVPLQHFHPLVSLVAALAGSILDSFAAHLMHCSLASQNTSVLFGLRGKSQRSIFHNPSLFQIVNKQLFLKFSCNVLGDALLPCVKHYKHVGKYNTCSITPAVDIANHVTAVHGQFGQLSREVLGSKVFSSALKSKFAQILVAKLLATANLWYNINENSLRSLDSIYNRIFRLVFLGRGSVDSTDISNKQFYIKHPNKNVLACIRGRRLRLYSRIICSAPPQLVQLLASSCAYEKSFVAELGRDLHWLFTS